MAIQKFIDTVVSFLANTFPYITIRYAFCELDNSHNIEVSDKTLWQDDIFNQFCIDTYDMYKNSFFDEDFYITYPSSIDIIDKWEVLYSPSVFQFEKTIKVVVETIVPTKFSNLQSDNIFTPNNLTTLAA
jgi:hypothetical protein